MLNGIGGRSIEEAQKNLSYSEVLSWIKYRNKRGSLNPMIRADRGFARLSTLYANAHRDSKKQQQPYTMFDFTPHEEAPPVSLNQAMEEWQ